MQRAGSGVSGSAAEHDEQLHAGPEQVQGSACDGQLRPAAAASARESSRRTGAGRRRTLVPPEQGTGEPLPANHFLDSVGGCLNTQKRRTQDGARLCSCTAKAAATACSL